MYKILTLFRVSLRWEASRAELRNGATIWVQVSIIISHFDLKGWLAIAKVKPLLLFISLLLMLKKEFDNIELEKISESGFSLAIASQPFGKANVLALKSQNSQQKWKKAFAPDRKQFLWRCHVSDYIYILNNDHDKFLLITLSSPASQQGSGCRTSQQSLPSFAEETCLSTSNRGRGAYLPKLPINYWSPIVRMVWALDK